MADTNQTPDMLPDKPPPKNTGCCSKIAAFLAIGPELRLALDLGSLRLALSLSLGRRDRERA